MPWLKYKYHQKKYFQKVEKKAVEQKKSNGSRARTKEQKDATPTEEKDEILDIAKRSGMDYNNYWDRVVLFFHLGDKYKEVSFKKCDMDQVELNSHRDDFLDTVDSYAAVLLFSDKSFDLL